MPCRQQWWHLPSSAEPEQDREDRIPASAIARPLKERGFSYAGQTHDGLLRFVGAFSIEGADVPIDFCVDPQGIRLPSVRVQSLPKVLRYRITPHLTEQGDLCYLGSQGLVVDVFNPTGVALACLERARAVLEQVLRGELVEEASDEFFAYWSELPSQHFIDTAPTDNRALSAIVFAHFSLREVCVFTSDPERTIQKFQSAGFIPKRKGLLAKSFATSAPPRPAKLWPPRDLRSLLAWQAQMDRDCARALKRGLKKSLKHRQRQAFCVVSSPAARYGFVVTFDYRVAPPGSRRRMLGRADRFRRAKIRRFNLWPVDDAYIASRSVPSAATLADRRILLIGCGTIGSYLAELLVKAGAGAGTGELRLVDKEDLLPANIGRHRLGFESILRNKASALSAELVRHAPTARLSAIASDATAVDLAGWDLIIDATGEEALGHWLAQKTQQAFVPSLAVWIEGPGTAIRALLTDTPGAACIRCLSDLARVPRYPVTNEPINYENFAGQGCESLYVPFPVTVSVQAACLAAEMVSRWASGKPQMKLQSRILDPVFSSAGRDLNPTKLSGCPACST